MLSRLVSLAENVPRFTSANITVLLDPSPMLTMAGQMLLDDGDLAFRKRIHARVDRGRVKVVLEMAGVSSIDSAGNASSAWPSCS